MLFQRIAHLLFVVSAFVGSVSVFLLLMEVSEIFLQTGLVSIGYILAYTVVGFVMAYRDLTRPATAEDENPPPARKWHLLTIRLTAALAASGLITIGVGFAGKSFLPFIFALLLILSALAMAVVSSKGVFEKMDQKRNEKLFPKPKPEPGPEPEPLPRKPLPEEMPGYQSSFDFMND